MKKGEVKQYIIPDDLDDNDFSITFDNSKTIGFQIGLSIDEKAFMQMADPGEEHNIYGRLPHNVNITIIFNSNQQYNTTIEVGRTYIYEPGDVININKIIFDRNQWSKIIDEETQLSKFKGYLEVIATKYNTKEESAYFDKEEEFDT